MFYRVIYTDFFIPKRFSAFTVGPFILMRTKYRDRIAPEYAQIQSDLGLLEHEKVHVRQFWANPAMFGVNYLLSKKARQGAEVEAYIEQLKFTPQNLVMFAGFLATNYHLGITQIEAVALLNPATSAKKREVPALPLTL